MTTQPIIDLGFQLGVIFLAAIFFVIGALETWGKISPKIAPAARFIWRWLRRSHLLKEENERLDHIESLYNIHHKEKVP